MKEEVVGVNEGQPIVVVKCDDSSNWVPIKSVNVETGTNTALGTIKREEDKKDYKRVDDMKLEIRQCDGVFPLQYKLNIKKYLRQWQQ